MRKIQKILKDITEKYISTIDSGSRWRQATSDVYENSSPSELAKLLKKYKTLRFYMNHEGGYIVWDANSLLHGDVRYDLPEWKDDDLRGQISNGEHMEDNYYGFTSIGYKGTYLYVLSAHKFYSKEGLKISKEDIQANNIDNIVSDEFKKSLLYQNLAKIGIDNVKLAKAL
jgi:hypothetical protein